MKALLVEDNSDILDIMAFFMESREFEVETASNVEDAVKLVEHGDFDIIVSDINFSGGLSGLEFEQWVRAKKPDQLFIFMTGDLDMVDELRKSLTKYTGVIGKPFEVTELNNVIESLIK